MKGGMTGVAMGSGRKRLLATVTLLVVGASQATLGHAATRTETIDYHDDTAAWVLGQVKKQTVDGVTTFEAQYGPLALPVWRKNFGALIGSYEYFSDGNLRSSSDGRNSEQFNTKISYSQWYRGVPQRIDYPPTPDQPSGAFVEASVSDHGEITSVVDENGYQTCYGYDAIGRLANIRPPSDAWHCDNVQANWNTTVITWAKASEAKYGLPIDHWFRTTRTGDGETLERFDALLRPVVTETYDLGRVSTTRSITVNRYDHDGRVVFQSYPARGLGTVNDALAGVVTDYDAIGRVTASKADSEHGVLTTSISYLPGFRTRVTSARGQVTGSSTITTFMAYDNPEEAWPTLVKQPEGVTTHISRDVFGKPVHIVRTDNQSLWDGRYFYYDAQQRLCREEALQEGSSARGYDAAGNLTWSAHGLLGTSGQEGCVHTEQSTAGVRVDRNYDQRSRLTSLTFAPDETGEGNGSQIWTYTPDGLPSMVRTRNVPTAGAAPTETINVYMYNTRRLLTNESVTVVGPAWQLLPLTYGYDRNGHLASHAYPTGHTVSYSPDSLGRPTAVTSASAGVTYASNVIHHPNGATASFTFGNGVAFNASQNARGMPARITHGWMPLDPGDSPNSAGTLLDNSYSYDYDGNVHTIADHKRLAWGHRWMAYDNLDRLIWAGSATFGQDHHLHFTYDILDNIRSWKSSQSSDPVFAGGARNDAYCYDARHRLTFLRVGAADCSSGSARVAFGYDERGNLRFKNSHRYSFDLGNRLREVVTPGASRHAPEIIERYRYDGHGRRVLASRIGGGPSARLGVILSQYSSAGQLMFQRNFRPETAKDTEYVYLNGTLLAQREVPQNGESGSIKFQHTDPLGTPVAITDSAGVLVERMDYNPYGGTVSGSLKDAPGFTGHPLDRLTGMNYMQQRYYDPGIGRFLSVDPVTAYANGDMRHFNRYSYAYNNPYKFSDPDGREPEWWKMLLGGASDTHGAERSMNSGIADSLRGELRAAESAFQVPQAVAQAVADTVSPDYVTGEANVSGTQGNLTYSKNGTMFVGAGVAMTDPSSMAKVAPSGSLTFGYVLGENAGPAVDAFLQGGSGSYGGCYVVCAGLRFNEGGTALEFGLGSPGLKVPAIEGATQLPVELPAWR